MERPTTTEELYNRICGILKEKGKMPDILDYGLPTHNPVPIIDYEFEFKNNLDYGSSEGIYLDGIFCRRGKACKWYRHI